MIFSDLSFICLFVILLIFYHFVESSTGRKFIILVTSLAFYGYWDVRFIPLLLFIAVSAHLFALWVAHVAANNRYAKMVTIMSAVIMIAPLVFFKYALFLASIVSSLTGIGLEQQYFSVILPLGISFFTFQGISYVIDVRNERANVDRNLLNVVIYITFFPQLVAGPIVRAGDFLYQLQDKRFLKPLDAATVSACMFRFLWGVAKKVFISDRLGSVIVDPVFADFSQHSGGAIIVATFAFGLQIYADFSAYSDMAISIARLMGFELKENFNAPYLSRNIRDFWRRWHISLSNIIRDLIYIPLGGGRNVSILRKSSAVSVAFILCGLWHGANWNFVLWGVLHGVALSGHNFFDKYCARPIPFLISWPMTQGIVMALWYVFRVPDLSTGIDGLNRIFDQGITPFDLTPTFLGICIVYYLVMLAEQAIVYHLNSRGPVPYTGVTVVKNVALSVGLITAMIALMDPHYGSTEFVYFQF